MATDVVRPATEPPLEAQPDRGILDRLIELPARLPGPDLLWYLALAPALAIVLSAPAWIAGNASVGSILTEVVGPSILAAYLLAAIHVLNGIARRAFEHFRPALGTQQPEERLLRDLTSTPDGWGLVVIAIAEAVVAIGFLTDDAAVRRFQSHWPSIAAGQAVAWVIATAAAALVIFHSVRQLRAVGRLHAAATFIDLFESGAIIAFSRLTSATAIALLIVPVLILASGRFEGVTDTSGFDIAQHVAIILLAVATFVIPLLGMHDRMAREKARLSHEVHDRLKATLARLHDGVDQDDLTAADQRHQTLASLLAERDLVAKLPTWPWSPGIVGGFVSAVLLPIALLLMTEVLQRMV
jgi:hypothetical protein